MRSLSLLVLTGAVGAAAFAPVRHSPLRPTAAILSKVRAYPLNRAWPAKTRRGGQTHADRVDRFHSLPPRPS